MFVFSIAENTTAKWYSSTFILVYDSKQSLGARERLSLEVRVVRRHRQHTERVRVPEAALPALDSDDSRSRLHQLQRERLAQTKPDAVVDVSLPLVRLDATRLRVPERINAPVEVNLARGLLAARNCKSQSVLRSRSL